MQRRDKRRDLVGLGPADIVEWRICLPLKTALRIPFGASVSQQEHPANHVRAPGWNGIVGQSLHNRSSA